MENNGGAFDAIQADLLVLGSHRNRGILDVTLGLSRSLRHQEAVIRAAGQEDRVKNGWISQSEEEVMDMQTLTTFFMWCTIINVGILMLWTVLFVFAPDFVYRTQNRWFPVSRETFTVVFYSFLGLFKAVVLVFNVVPYVALLIVA